MRLRLQILLLLIHGPLVQDMYPAQVSDCLPEMDLIIPTQAAGGSSEVSHKSYLLTLACKLMLGP